MDSAGDRGQRGPDGGQTGAVSISLLSLAAARLRRRPGRAMTCRELIGDIVASGEWQSSGKTPEATLYAAIIREIQTKGVQSRFRKTGPGLFAATGC